VVNTANVVQQPHISSPSSIPGSVEYGCRRNGAHEQEREHSYPHAEGNYPGLQGHGNISPIDYPLVGAMANPPWTHYEVVVRTKEGHQHGEMKWHNRKSNYSEGSTSRSTVDFESSVEQSSPLQTATSRSDLLYTTPDSATSSMDNDSATGGRRRLSRNWQRPQVQQSHSPQFQNAQQDILFDHMDGHTLENVNQYSDNDTPLVSGPATPNNSKSSHQTEHGGEVGDGLGYFCTEPPCVYAVRRKEFANKASLR
jgi:hypothetical protein